MRSIFTLSLICLVPSAAISQEDEREVPLPYVTLIQPPFLPKLDEVELSQDRIDEIEGLIRSLSSLADKDIGLLRSSTLHVFLPVGDFSVFGQRRDHYFDSYRPLQRIVEIGPDALPFLLEALEDDSPTELVVETEKREGAFPRGMEFDEILHGNPANPTERYVLNLNLETYTASTRKPPFWSVANEIEAYRVKVGDVCLVAIGQIVGRDYECLSYSHVKSLGVVVCSPVHRETMRNQVRRIWQSENPRQKLFESLLLDFSTRGLVAENSFGNWSIGNGFQVRAAMRMLYYYPDETADLIAKRLDSLDFSVHWSDAFEKDGISANELIETVGWSNDPKIRQSLRSIATRAKEPDTLGALQRAGILQDDDK